MIVEVGPEVESEPLWINYNSAISIDERNAVVLLFTISFV